MLIFRRIVVSLDRAGPHYLGLIMAGISGIAWPSPRIQEVALVPLSVYFWLGSLIIGGALCVVGRWRHLAKLKSFGLLLILVALGTYVLSLLFSWPETASGFWFMLSLMSLLGYRLKASRRSHDAGMAVSRGSASGPDLVTYARDRLARNRHDGSWHSSGSVGSREGEGAQSDEPGPVA